MNWIQPSWLGLLPVVVLLATIVGLAGMLHRRRIRGVFPGDFFDRILPPSVRRRRTIRDVSWLIALALGCVALAEPAFDKEITQIHTKGVDLVIALDLSRSMAAQDVDPNRLERARREIADLLEEMVGDRVAVIFFAGEAVARLPLTQDYRAVEWVLEGASPDLFRAQGSAVGKAIDSARELLARDEGKAGKAMVIFSDGETHDPEDAIRAANEAHAEGLIIYAMGIGDSAAPIPTSQGPLKYQGKVVTTTPTFDVLQDVARITGGAFVKSVPSASDTQSLYHRAIKPNVAAVNRESFAAEHWKSAYQYPLGLGLLFWLLGAWLGEGKRGFAAAT